MNPRPITQADLDRFAEFQPQLVTYTAEGEPGCDPVQCLVTVDEWPEMPGRVVRVPWTLDEISLVHLAQGGTLWLNCWGGLPPHQLEVTAP